MHIPLIFKTVGDTDLTVFCAGAESALREQLDGYLRAGTTRPRWCWLALDPTGQARARHYWWGRPDAPRPQGVELVSAEDHTAAVALLGHARERLDVTDAWCCITAPVGEGDDPSVARANLVAVLADCGFGFEVARVTLEWSVGSEIPPDSGRLVFRPAHSLPDEVLVSLFSAVADGSLDHGMIADRARLGVEDEARHRLQSARAYRAEPDWFQVAYTQAGEPVGYVVPGFADDAPMIGEIGVVASERGHRYVDDLLGWATQRLATRGAGRIIADTDRANTPMRTAFNRAGYREFRWRDDYGWHRDQPRQSQLGIPEDVTIHTRRLELTALRIDDADEMVSVLDDGRLHEFTGGSPDTVGELRDRYRRLVAGSPQPTQIWLNWVVRHNHVAIGAIQATITTAQDRRASAEVAWVVGHPWQGNGFASEAAESLIAWLRGHGIDDVTAHIHPDHRASQTVARRAGLHPTDEHHDGETVWRLTLS